MQGRSTTASRLDFENRTALDCGRLETMLGAAVEPWPVGRVTVRVRPSRGADFSGSCLYRLERIYVNLGSHLRYPYRLNTYLARAVTHRRTWSKPLYYLEIADGYQLVLFVFLHEWYHLLVKRARRNTRQKESMCDRFAARYLVDRLGLTVRNPEGQVVARSAWDFQDLEGFVAGACKSVRQPTSVKMDVQAARSSVMAEPVVAKSQSSGQLLLFHF